MIHDLSKNNSLIGNFMSELRDVKIQKDAMRFRRNLERLAEVIGYEISKSLAYKEVTIETPLGEADVNVLNEVPVLATILRAGLSMHQGLLNYFDNADCAFISAYRKHTSSEEFAIEVEYLASPDISNKTVILCDPMLATGASMVAVYKALLKQGKPSKLYIVSAVASKEAVEYVRQHLPANTEIWVGAIDSELTAHSYIVPGIGDAGDLAFGVKC